MLQRAIQIISKSFDKFLERKCIKKDVNFVIYIRVCKRDIEKYWYFRNHLPERLLHRPFLKTGEYLKHIISNLEQKYAIQN